MAQEINQAGIVDVPSSVEKQVIFNRRRLKKIYINSEEFVTILFEYEYDEGKIEREINVSYKEFNENAENSLWSLVDKEVN